MVLSMAVPAWAGPALKRLKMTMSEDRKVAEISVPEGFAKVVIERRKSDGTWKRFVVRDSGKSGRIRFRIPKAFGSSRWRAVGVFDSEVVSKSKFPASFYLGNRTFDPVKGGRSVPSIAARGGVVAFASSDGGAKSGEGAEPVEADIWKTAGDTVYFFNQLRGLQVIGISDPADPRLLATLRLPALGEDLYLLPPAPPAFDIVSGESVPATQDLVLLTRSWGSSDDGRTKCRIQIVRHQGDALTIVHTAEMDGNPIDSRMVGGRLVVTTSDWSYAGGAYRSKVRLHEWVLSGGAAPVKGAVHEFAGYGGLLAGGAGWLALSVTPENEWYSSAVTVFSLREERMERMNAVPIRARGWIGDKFKMQWKDNVLTTISSQWGRAGNWRPVTVLENFRVWAPDVIRPAVVEDSPLASLELADGESLYATRFAGDKAYIVTFLQTDPLWVVDLSDPKQPVVAGHLEVPGWSTHLEPMGDFLFSVGWESGTVAASLFDVADPADPKLVERINLPGNQSEAVWDEKALRVLPEAGLALIPLGSFDWSAASSSASVQLVDIDLAVPDLRLRGAIRHDFDARRSAALGDTVLSISQREFLAADISDRDAPEVISEVALAWPVDLVVDAGAHVIQIESGSLSFEKGRATARVSGDGSTEAILSETDLGEGVVKAAVLKGGRLYVLKQVGNDGWFWGWRRSSAGKDEKPALLFDVYDAGALPALTRLGGCEVDIGQGVEVVANRILWPQADRAAVVLRDRRSWWWYGGPRIAIADDLVVAGAAAASAKLSILPGPGESARGKAPRLVVFDFADPAAPVVGERVALGTADTEASGFVAAAGGLVVVGCSDFRFEADGRKLEDGKQLHTLRVVEVPESGDPVVRPAVDLPGRLVFATEIDSRGFLAFARSAAGDGVSRFTALASDGLDAYEVASFDIADAGPVAFAGREVFVASGKTAERRVLTDGGVFTEESDIALPWAPEFLQYSGGILIGSDATRLFAWQNASRPLDQWSFDTWASPSAGVRVAADGDLLLPRGQYGLDRLER